MSSCHHKMLYIFLILFFVIICSINGDKLAFSHHNVRDKELMVKHTQTIQNYQSRVSESNITEKLRPAQSMDVKNLTNVILRVYAGSVTILQCRIRPRLADTKTVIWFYSPNNLSLKLLQEDETIINKWNLTIYNIKLQHAGSYRCATDRQQDAIILLEVVEDEKYDVVKPLSSKGPYASEPVVINSQLIMWSVWSEWSECSRCHLVGRRRRYGICYVTLVEPSKIKQNASIYLQVFQTFPGGIPCRSQILPPYIRNTRTVQTKNNEIMIGLCKVECKESIFKIRSKSGIIIETANNTAGIYSLSQNKPPQPPPPTRTILYVEPGQRVLIKCPGTTLRDIPFTWRVDTREINPRDLDKRSRGRVHLNARDHIVFTSVLYSDAHVYSCWQDNVLAGVVKLRVQRDAESTHRVRVTLLTVNIALIMVLRLTTRLVRRRQRYLNTV